MKIVDFVCVNDPVSLLLYVYSNESDFGVAKQLDKSCWQFFQLVDMEKVTDLVIHTNLSQSCFPTSCLKTEWPFQVKTYRNHRIYRFLDQLSEDKTTNVLIQL